MQKREIYCFIFQLEKPTDSYALSINLLIVSYQILKKYLHVEIQATRTCNTDPMNVLGKCKVRAQASNCEKTIVFALFESFRCLLSELWQAHIILNCKPTRWWHTFEDLPKCLNKGPWTPALSYRSHEKRAVLSNENLFENLQKTRRQSKIILQCEPAA